MRALVGLRGSLSASLALALCARFAAAQEAPRLLSPRPGACALTATPTLRWRGVSNVASWRVRACRDRACATPLFELDARGETAVPPSALPAGVVFWRVEADGRTSATWSFTVTARPGPHDVTAPACADLDGDGYGDALVQTATDAHRIAFLWGSPRGLVRRGAQRLVEPPTRYGLTVQLAGDLDGDGYADLLASSHDVSSPPGGRAPSRDHAGAVLLYRGGRRGVQVRASVRLDPRAGEEFFGGEVRVAGDVDGDGRGDLLVDSSPSAHAPSRHACVQLRRRIFETTTVTAADVDFEGFHCSNQGRDSGAAGDVDGDGFGDVILARDGDNGRTPAVRLYHGSPDGLTRAEDLDLSAVRVPSDVRVEVGALGDINGDGFGDFALAWERSETSVAGGIVWHGAAAGPLVARPLARPPRRADADEEADFFGMRAGGVGDLDRDGRDDAMLAVSDRTLAFVRNGDLAAPTLFSRGDGLPVGFFGGFHQPCGDVNGDGFLDVLVGSTCAETDAQSGDACVVREYHLFRGGADGISESRHDVLTDARLR
jgi:hypothetical protein